jgi:hypothetical protein
MEDTALDFGSLPDGSTACYDVHSRRMSQHLFIDNRYIKRAILGLLFSLCLTALSCSSAYERVWSVKAELPSASASATTSRTHALVNFLSESQERLARKPNRNKRPLSHQAALPAQRFSGAPLVARLFSQRENGSLSPSSAFDSRPKGRAPPPIA